MVIVKIESRRNVSEEHAEKAIICNACGYNCTFTFCSSPQCRRCGSVLPHAEKLINHRKNRQDLIYTLRWHSAKAYSHTWNDFFKEPRRD